MQIITTLNFQICDKFTIETGSFIIQLFTSCSYVYSTSLHNYTISSQRFCIPKQFSLFSIPECLCELKSKLKISFVAPFGSTERTVEPRWTFASFPLPDTNLSDVLKYIQSILLPVKCCRLKLIVRANHLYSPLTRDRKKCDPVTPTGIVFFCGGKENILVCKALLPCVWPLSSKLFWTVFIYNTNSCVMMGLAF